MQTIQKGFSLIELMIVVAIIGILAAFAIPAYQNYIARTQVSEALSLASALKSAIVDTFAQDGVCPDNSDATKSFGIALPATITGKYVLSTATAGTAPACTIIATMKGAGAVSTGIQDRPLMLKMSNTGGALNWACTSTIEQKYLPKSCLFVTALDTTATAPTKAPGTP